MPHWKGRRRTIWVWTDHKDGLDAIKQGLEHSLPLGVKVLRLLAKRLLVDGGSVHRALFAQSREEARDFFLVAEKTFPRADQIVQPAELGDIGRDTQLSAVLNRNRLVQGCFLDLRTQGRHEEKERTAVKARLDETLERHKQELERHKLDSEESRRELSRLQEQLSQLEKDVEEAKRESRLRLQGEESAARELARVRRKMGWVLAVAVTVTLALVIWAVWA